MIDFFNLTDNSLNNQVFYANGTTSWQIWQKPNNAKSFNTEEERINDWREEFLQRIKSEYNEKNCYMCKNKVPEEGIVLTKEGEFFEPYKLKSNNFLLREFLIHIKNKLNSNIGFVV